MTDQQKLLTSLKKGDTIEWIPTGELGTIIMNDEEYYFGVQWKTGEVTYGYTIEDIDVTIRKVRYNDTPLWNKLEGLE